VEGAKRLRLPGMFSRIRFLTSGESHGQALACIIDGIPAGLHLTAAHIDSELARRQRGYGRGGRMKIESDCVDILSGVRHGMTLGSPLSMLIKNKDWENWGEVMNPAPVDGGAGTISKENDLRIVTRPRPGHADLTGALKYGHRDIRNVLERSSARETAARVAAGAVAKRLLDEFGISVRSYVVEIGGVKIQGTRGRGQGSKEIESLFRKAEISEVRCPDEDAGARMVRKINAAMKKGDTLGGVFEVLVTGVPAGLGSYGQWDRRLEAKLAYAVMGIQAIKGVEIGLGFEVARIPGSEVMDEIYYRAQSTEHRAQSTEHRAQRTERGGRTLEKELRKTAPGKYSLAGGFYRKTNNAGGIEGGMSNGMPIVLRAAMKPIPTLRRPLASVDINSKKKFTAAYERSDVCAVPAASVIGEAVCAIVIADAFLDKFGGDSIEETRRNYEGYLRQMREF
jgi:chorismate synthase